jgi:hypothetical protein
MSLTGAITYVVVLPQPSGNEIYSPFQWFSGDILQRTATIRAILRLPSSVFELAREREEALIGRLRGVAPYQIVPLYVDSLTAIIRNPLYPFLCVVSGPATVDEIQTLAETAPRPVLHVTTTRREHIAAFDSLTRAQLLDYCRVVTDQIEASGDPLPMLRLPNTPPAWGRVTLPVHAGGHPVALPNELALGSRRRSCDRTTKTNSTRKVAVGTVKKSMEAICPT